MLTIQQSNICICLIYASTRASPTKSGTIELPKKILIIEDEEAITQAIARALRRENFQVAHSPNGRIGLARALGEHPDVIILDIIMPEMDGIAFLQKLRRAPTPIY